MPLHSLSNVTPSTSWWSHGGNEDDILNFHEWLFLLRSIIPTFVVHPLSKDLDWRLCTVNFLLGHIQIINEYDESFACWWSINTFSSLFKLLIKSILRLVCRGLSRECNWNVLVFFWKLIGKENLNVHCFASACWTWAENMLFMCEKKLL